MNYNNVREDFQRAMEKEGLDREAAADIAEIFIGKLKLMTSFVKPKFAIRPDVFGRIFRGDSFK